ncbi:hypothetical protein [Acinetobacter wanghuae]|uniref:hypothetical protein n=1 Tax=Acinetobacter wanghuae TaxID=2662362 RepID=UPI003AF7AE37
MSSDHAQSIIETSAAVSSMSSKTAVGAVGISAGAKWLGLDPITLIGLLIGIGGLVISVIGTLITWHYKRKDERRKELEEKRKQELHALQIKQLQGGCNVKD